jgi:hypothetical protein
MATQEYVRVDAVPRLSALDYPGTPPTDSGVLDGDRFWPGRDPGKLDGRHLVLAVGSNASPGVLTGKLRRAGATGSVPMVRVEVDGLAVGHSAHVSRGGYVPAAPYAASDTTTAWGLWLTREQRVALDATEPNYTRVRLRAADRPIALEDGGPPTAYELYVSRWGVLAVDGERPVPLGSQLVLHARLAEVEEFATLAPWRDPEAAVSALADPVVQARIREALDAAGWVAAAGL